AYLPLDPQLPEQRLKFILEDAQPRALLTTSALASNLPSQAVCIDTLALDALPEHSPQDDQRRTPLRSEHPAYLIYTSGSTGNPKAVVIQHASIARYIDFVGRDVLGS